MAPVKPIPDNYPRVNAYLCVDGAAQALDFYAKIFGAKERMRMAAPDGKIGHAEIEIGTSVIMLADEFPEMNALGPKTVGGSPITMHVFVEDVDQVFASAIAAGARSVREVADQFYGDRLGMFETRLDTSGAWPRTSRTFRPKRWSAAAPKRWRGASRLAPRSLRKRARGSDPYRRRTGASSSWSRGSAGRQKPWHPSRLDLRLRIPSASSRTRGRSRSGR